MSVTPGGSASAIATTTTGADGSYNIVFTGPGGNNLLYLTSSGGNAGGGTSSNNQFMAIVGTSASFQPSQRINEITTAASEYVAFNFGLLLDTSGAVTLKASKNAAGVNNLVTQYNNIIATGNLSSNASLSTSAKNALKTMANAFAYCIETPGNCSTLFTNAAATSGASAVSLLESGYNALNNSANDASGLYTLAFPLNASTGYTLSSSSLPGGFTFNNALPVTTTTFTAGSAITVGSIDANGNLWITNNNNSGTVTELNSSGSIVQTISVGDFAPAGSAIDANGNIWVPTCGSSTACNGGGNNVYELNSSGTILGTFAGGTGTYPQGIAIDNSGNVWITDARTNSVVELNSSGTLIGTFSVGTANYPFTYPAGVAIDSSGNVWVANNNNNGGTTVTRLNSAGTVTGTLTVATAPQGISFDPSGDIWVTSLGTTKVTELNSLGTNIGSFTANTAYGTAIDPLGSVWVFANASTVYEFSSAGVQVAKYSVSTTSASGLIDASGNIWTGGGAGITRISGITNGPQFFPYSGPQFP